MLPPLQNDRKNDVRHFVNTILTLSELFQNILLNFGKKKLLELLAYLFSNTQQRYNLIEHHHSHDAMGIYS